MFTVNVVKAGRGHTPRVDLAQGLVTHRQLLPADFPTSAGHSTEISGFSHLI